MKKLTGAILIITYAANLQYAEAAPSLSNYSGTLTTGQEITINGTGMGTKTVPRPLKYENVESGVFISTWGDTYDLATSNAAGQRWTGSSYYAAGNMTGSTRNNKFQESNDVYQTWYIQFWMFLDNNFDFGTPCNGFGCANQFFSNVKIIRFWNPGSNVENLFLSYSGEEDQLYLMPENIGGETLKHHFDNASTRFPKNRWFLVQCEFRDSSVNTSDGIFRLWIDGEEIINRTTLKTREDETEFKRPRIIGFEDEWGEGSNGDYAPNNFRMDDIVVDNSWTRLEISTCSTYATAGCRYEYQRLNSVSDTQSKFLFSQGQLPNGAAVYGFWTHSDGSRNTTGLSMTVGGSGGGGVDTTLNPISSNISTGAATLTWTTAGSSAYKGVWSTDSGFSSIIATGTITSNTTSLYTLSAATQYHFRVKVSSEPDSAYEGANTTNFFTNAMPLPANRKINMGGNFRMSGGLK